MSINERLAEEYDLTIFESEAPDRAEVDFSVYWSYGDDNVAWVWGDKDDYEVECNHPNIEYEDDETQGYCPICGKYCDWSYHVSADDGYEIKERVPHEWHEGDGGIIKEYIKEVYGRQQSKTNNTSNRSES